MALLNFDVHGEGRKYPKISPNAKPPYDMIFTKDSHEPAPGANKINLSGQTNPFSPIYTPIEIDKMSKDMTFVMTDKSAKLHMLDFLAQIEDAGGDNSLYDLLAKEQPTIQEIAFFNDFVLWLAGKCKNPQDMLHTPWLYNSYRNNEPWDYKKHVVPGEDVKQFLTILLDARRRFMQELEILKMSFSGGLINAYIYFKYLVRANQFKWDDTKTQYLPETQPIVDTWFGDLRYLVENNVSKEEGSKKLLKKTLKAETSIDVNTRSTRNGSRYDDYKFPADVNDVDRKTLIHVTGNPAKHGLKVKPAPKVTSTTTTTTATPETPLPQTPQEPTAPTTEEDEGEIPETSSDIVSFTESTIPETTTTTTTTTPTEGSEKKE